MKWIMPGCSVPARSILRQTASEHKRGLTLPCLLARRVDGIFLSEFEQGEIGPDLFRHVCLLGAVWTKGKHPRAPTAAAGSGTGSR